MNEKFLTDRVAIVTGGGRGLGRAMALGLAQAGARVLVTDIDQDVVERTTEDIRNCCGGNAASGMTIDLTAENAPASVVARARAELGGLHIIVNNAGVGPEMVRRDFMTNPPKLWEIPPQAWRRTFAVNTDAPFYMVRAAVPGFLAQGWGRIINVTTNLDTMIRAGYAPYGGSKAANEAHAAILAQELRGSGITVNVLIPGGPANTRLIPEDAPLRREDLIQPEAMVPPLLWLASDRAADITGRRFLAMLWDAQRSPEEAAAKAGSPIAWPQLGRAAPHALGTARGRQERRL